MNQVCAKCGYNDNGTGDFAHLCNPLPRFSKPDTITLSITEYEQLVADKKRIDWLADNYYSCTMDNFDKMTHPNRIAWRFYGKPNAQGDVRYVLDQAIAKDKP